jgi:hypothetical protein
MVADRMQDFSQRERRRLIASSVARSVLNVAMLLVVYALWPVEPITSSEAFGRLVLVLVIVVVVVAMQVAAIKSASYPALRAIEAVIIAVTVFIVLFALLYLALAQANPANFSQPLNRVSAFYFTVTTLATVGFGDISAQSDLARVVVTVQMLLDLALLTIVIRVFFSVARVGGDR